MDLWTLLFVLVHRRIWTVKDLPTFVPKLFQNVMCNYCLFYDQLLSSTCSVPDAPCNVWTCISSAFYNGCITLVSYHWNSPSVHFKVLYIFSRPLPNQDSSNPDSSEHLSAAREYTDSILYILHNAFRCTQCGACITLVLQLHILQTLLSKAIHKREFTIKLQCSRKNMVPLVSTT